MQKLKKSFFTLVVLAVGMGVLSCVSPFYGTARIEPGWHMNAGVAATSFISSDNYDECMGGRGDLEISHGFNQYLQANGRIGLGLGYIPPSPEDKAVSPRKGGFYPLLDGGLGLQTAYPMECITPALRVEAGQELSLMPMVGIGRREWLTLGGEGTYFLFGPEGTHPEGGFLNAFLIVHPYPRWSIFAGVNVTMLFDPGFYITEYPLVTVGVGYKLIK